MQSILDPSPWKRYKRYSDNISVEARLVTIHSVDGILKERWMQVRESRGAEICCPACKETLSHFGGNELPDFILRPKIFHDKHKPLDVK